jgi:NADPH2:quinone reductase
VLIRVEAVGVNRPDVAQRSGKYPPPPGASPILGLECAGRGVAPRRRRVQASRWATSVCAPHQRRRLRRVLRGARPAQVLPWPAGFDALRAAAIPETYFTVWANLFGHGRLAAGETVLVHGGTSASASPRSSSPRPSARRSLTTAGLGC